MSVNSSEVFVKRPDGEINCYRVTFNDYNGEVRKYQKIDNLTTGLCS